MPNNYLRRRVKALLYDLRLMPGAPNIFGTESSFEPPIGSQWAPDEPIRGYYIDFSLKNESPEWPPYWTVDLPRRDQFGVAYAQWGLGAFERYLRGEGEQWLQAARSAADHIVDRLERGGRLDGAWLHLLPMPHTFPLDPPWISAMAQGEFASLLTRVYLETGEEQYAESALRALNTVRLPVSEGGTLTEVDGHPMLEEYPTATPSAVLNGAIFAIWGLYDVGHGLGDAETVRFFAAATDGMAALIDRYDCGYWSRYDLYPHRLPNLASPSYHLLHIRQLTALDRLSPRPALAAAAARFEAYRGKPALRRRAMAEKVAFRLVVPRNPLFAKLMPRGAANDEGTAASSGDERPDALVLCYHAVSESWPADLSISPARLREHLAYLVERGYRGVTFSELVADGASGKVVAVTFDDGYRSVIELAQPILAEYGFPATLFVTTDWIGSERPMAWPGIEQWLGGEHESELVPMSWDEVRRLRDAGWEIGSHTCSHPKLSEIPFVRVSAELDESRRRCEDALGSCRSIAYPYGDYDESVVLAAGAAGYAAAATLPDGAPPSRPLAWTRVGIYHDDDMRAFRLKVSPLFRRARGSAAWPVFASGLRSLKRRVAA